MKLLNLLVMFLIIIGIGSAITISGSTTALPLVELLAESSPVHATVSGGGSGVGVINTQTGFSDIGMVSRNLTAKETGLKLTPIAYDGILVITSKELGVHNITSDQLKAIYNGTITNWKEIGGPDRDIYAITREDGSGTQDTFAIMIMGSSKAEMIGTHTVASNNGEVVLAVRGSNKAIGYVGFNYGNSTTMNILSIDGVQPSPSTIKDGTYQLNRQLSLVTLLGNQLNDVQQFINFALGTEGQSIAAQNGYIPL